MLLVATLRVGELHEDLPLVARSPPRETSVHGGLRAFVGEIACPATTLGRRCLCRVGLHMLHAGLLWSVIRTDPHERSPHR